MTVQLETHEKDYTLAHQEIERRAKLARLLIRRRQHIQHQHPPYRRLLITGMVLLMFFLTVFSGGIGAAEVYYQAQLPYLNILSDRHVLFQTTHIYDRYGRLLYSLYDNKHNDRGRRTYVDFSTISPLLINATIAAEDHTFWTNSGVDPGGIVRAAYLNMQRHGIVEGGSTITQQLVKNQFFVGKERTYEVKSQEAMLAAGLTERYPKWKIMEMYLNTVYYGDLNYGIEAAAQDYFGLQPLCVPHHPCLPAVARLNLAQAAMLAGLPQSPTTYNPIQNKAAALQRQSSILDAMVQLGYITRVQANQARKEMQRYHFYSHSNVQPAIAPHFVQYVIDQVLQPMLGESLSNGGYNIYTTLDLDLENKVEQIVYNHLYKEDYDPFLGYSPSLSITHNVNNGAAIVMNPHNGEILAMDGSANYHENKPTMNGLYNAALAPRQPGSSFKPIVYSTAFELGWYPAMIIPDHRTIFPRKDGDHYYMPQNYDGSFHSGFPMTVRNALANSFNIPAIDALMFAGIPNVLNMAGRLGLGEVVSQSPAMLGPAMALGAVDVSLLHLTGAYATFANKGVRVPPVAVLKIADHQGHMLYQYDEQHPHGIRAMREDIAFLMSSILSDKPARYHEFAPGNPLELDRPAAAKTGTTDSFRDNWTMGYTPHLTVGVWAGNSDNSIMWNVIGITGAGPIWHDIMEYAAQKYHFPADGFAKPADVHQATVSAYTGLQAAPGEATVTDWFIDGTVPTIHSATYIAPTSCYGYGCLPSCRWINCYRSTWGYTKPYRRR